MPQINDERINEEQDYDHYSEQQGFLIDFVRPARDFNRTEEVEGIEIELPELPRRQRRDLRATAFRDPKNHNNAFADSSDYRGKLPRMPESGAEGESAPPEAQSLIVRTTLNALIIPHSMVNKLIILWEINSYLKALAS